MAQSVARGTSPRIVAISPDDGSQIDLHNPAYAAVLSWLVPGLGQLYQGRTTKGGLFMGSLLFLLVCGMWLGGGRVVYASWRPGEPRLAFLAQAGIGSVAVPALLQSLRLEGAAREPLVASDWFAPPLRPGQLVSPRYAARVLQVEPDIDADDFFARPPFRQFTGDQLSTWNARLGRGFEYGTLYTVFAGLLNMLVVFDAWAGPYHEKTSRTAEPPAAERPPTA